MFEFFILTLVTWRISYMLVEEDGPFDCFDAVREFFRKIRLPVFDCFKCTSVWVGVLIAIGWFGTYGIFYGLALSSASIIIYMLHELMYFKTIQ